MPSNSGDFEDDDRLARDKLSTSGASERRSVHPYRDRREGLIARHRLLRRELTEVERAVVRRDRIRSHLASIDEELSECEPPLLDATVIQSPCRVPWDEMAGDEVVRHCRRCARDVYDLAHMTREEIDVLFARAESTPCVRLRRRSDGRVVTAECPVASPSIAARTMRVVAAGVLFGASAAGAAAVLSAFDQREPPPARARPVALPRPLPARPPDPQFIMGQPLVPAAIEAGDLDHHIRWIAPQAWEIDRVLVDRALALSDPTHGTGARYLGHRVGVRVFGIRRGSLLGRLGIHNGDTIIDVNGYPIRAGAPWESYPSLRTADALFVRLVRRDEELIHVYRIR